ncbi:MAG: hypothetical protein NXH86_08890 [Flavobacteriaceae bacterium]|uniref:hypothetical protein n=1 Tax=Flagellimonas TaxID=444459 RepID=UPI003BAB2C25|nr:hypothetical protein [Flavobacteriaceae bacterium]
MHYITQNRRRKKSRPKDFSKVQKAVQKVLDDFEKIKINQGKKLNGNQLKQRSNKIWEVLENPHKIK